MKRRFITHHAQASREEIAAFIAQGDIAKASDYFDITRQMLADFDERFLPARASEHLPDYVYKTAVPGFKGYFLWIAVTDDVIAVVAAFRPGLTAAMQRDRADAGLDEL